VARLEPIKGIHVLLAAAAKSLGNEVGWRLEVFGRGPDEARLKALAGDLGLSERVQFRGYVRELRDIWADNHILVSPAVEDGVPMTIPEAMLCGRPVLATPVGGAADWITPGSSGFISLSSRQEDLSATLRLAWEARGQWREMGQRAAEQAHARYRADDFLSLIAAVPVRS
jgi:L-malate glycosyltransferase